VVQLTLLQVTLGITTLILAVPVWLGVAHQVNAAILLLAVVTLIHASRVARS
jgi:cytochrome c oxidase assembly protein subunit 15